jgi:hypothetical protein
LRKVTPGPPIGTWTALPGDSTVITDDARSRISNFTTYGDWAFFANGVNNLKKIRRHDLKVYDLGLPPPTSGDLPTTHRTGERLSQGSSGLKIGVYQYRFTFVYASGGESNGSDDTIRVEVPGDAKVTGVAWWQAERDPNVQLNYRSYVRFDGLPSLSDYGSLRDDIRHINVYRTFANGSLFFYAGTVHRGRTSFLDTIPDAMLGESMPLDNGQPPVGRFVEVHNDTLWILGNLGEGAGDTCAYSLKGAPDIFPFGYIIPQTEWANAGKATGLRSLGGTLYFFFERAIFKLVGDNADSYGITPITTTFGCIAPDTLRVYEDQFIFLSKPGLMGLRGGSYTHIRTALDAEMKDWPWQSFENAAAVVVGDQYFISMPGVYYRTSSTKPSAMRRPFIINLKNQLCGIPGFSFDIGSNDGPNDYPIVTQYIETGGGGASVYAVGPFYKNLAAVDTDATVLEFNWEDLGTPDQEKVVQKVEMDIITHSRTNFRVTLLGEDEQTETYTPVTNRTYIAWNLENWSSDAAELYNVSEAITVQAFFKAITGRRFQLTLQLLNLSPYDTRELIISAVKFYYSFRKRR